jgi:hypothetical protein
MSRLSRDDLSISICRPTKLIVGSRTRCSGLVSHQTRTFRILLFTTQTLYSVIFLISLFFNNSFGIIKSPYFFFYLRSSICLVIYSKYDTFTSPVLCLTVFSFCADSLLIRFLFGCYSVAIRFLRANNKRIKSVRTTLCMVSKPYDITSKVLLIFKIYPLIAVLTGRNIRNVLFTT